MATVAGVLAALSTAGSSYAQVTTDMIDFSINASAFTVDGTAFHTSSGYGGAIDWRWLDDPDYPTTIRVVYCGSLETKSEVGYGAHDTAYQAFGTVGIGTCFQIGGKVLPGNPSLVNHDGRVRR